METRLIWIERQMGRRTFIEFNMNSNLHLFSKPLVLADLLNINNLLPAYSHSDHIEGMVFPGRCMYVACIRAPGKLPLNWIELPLGPDSGNQTRPCRRRNDAHAICSVVDCCNGPSGGYRAQLQRLPQWIPANPWFPCYNHSFARLLAIARTLS